MIMEPMRNGSFLKIDTEAQRIVIRVGTVSKILGVPSVITKQTAAIIRKSGAMSVFGRSVSSGGRGDGPELLFSMTGIT